VLIKLNVIFSRRSAALRAPFHAAGRKWNGAGAGAQRAVQAGLTVQPNNSLKLTGASEPVIEKSNGFRC